MQSWWVEDFFQNYLKKAYRLLNSSVAWFVLNKFIFVIFSLTHYWNITLTKLGKLVTKWTNLPYRGNVMLTCKTTKQLHLLHFDTWNCLKPVIQNRAVCLEETFAISMCTRPSARSLMTCCRSRVCFHRRLVNCQQPLIGTCRCLTDLIICWPDVKG